MASISASMGVSVWRWSAKMGRQEHADEDPRLAGESMIRAAGGQGGIAILTYPEVTLCQHLREGFSRLVG